MTRILITGMSGTGKSSLVAALSQKGFRAVDLDDDAWSCWVPCAGNPTGARPGHDWVWKEDAVRDLLSADADTAPLFVSGCAPNMRRFLPYFDRVVLLDAPLEVMFARIGARVGNPYGQNAAEVERIVANHREVQPLLRTMATDEIDATQPFEQVLAIVAGFADGGDGAARMTDAS